MSQTVIRSETIMSMDEDQHSNEDLAWTRFWLGIGCVLVFAIASILLVIALGGVHAGASYGLVVLAVTLTAALVDGVVLRRRRNR